MASEQPQSPRIDRFCENQESGDQFVEALKKKWAAEEEESKDKRPEEKPE